MKLPKKVKNKPYGTQNGRALLRKWKFAALDQILSAQKINASRQTAVACIKIPRVQISLLLLSVRKELEGCVLVKKITKYVY